VTFLVGSSVDPHLATSMLAQVQRPLLVVLDSDHSEAHVRRELELYAPALAVGDRMVVEDTNVAWTHDRGARGALEDYLEAHPGEFRQDILCERFLLSMHPGGWLERVAECPHKPRQVDGHHRRPRR
jgi:cephalosporin hydroxylase